MGGDLSLHAALFSKRLWHQLTEKLETCVKDPVFVPILPEMYEKFIQDFALKVRYSLGS